jgi:hypothetical protein
LRHAASATTIPTAKIDDLGVTTYLRGVSSSAPYAQAAGLVTNFSDGALAPGSGANHVTLTFPAGRFSVAPVVLLTFQSIPANTIYLDPRVSTITATSCEIYIYNTGTTTVAYSGLHVAWTATQMTPSSAAG